jgi:hypothetical protein
MRSGKSGLTLVKVEASTLFVNDAIIREGFEREAILRQEVPWE